MVGWLIEGVFCGYFNPQEADVLWVNLERLRACCGSPSHPLVAPILASQIKEIYRSADPFHSSRQMPGGAQKEFELPLFPHALHLSDRWVGDSLAAQCSSFLVSTSEERLFIADPDVPVDPVGVATALVSNEATGSNLEGLLAGFVHMLEHMDESRTFFEFARERSDSKRDFSSYRERIGSLNAWRVPLFYQRAPRKIDDLQSLLEFALRTSMRDGNSRANWSSIEGPLESNLRCLVDSWESDHFISFLEYA
jgi:hypothetical protein